MKKRTILHSGFLLILMVCLVAPQAFAQDEKVKGPPYIKEDYPPVRQGGDNIGDAMPIEAFPFNDNGTTCGYTQDYDGGCGLTGNAPDVVYSFVAGTSGTMTISLCGSLYDCAIYVMDNDPSTVIACNDDFCGLQSQLNNVAVTAGNTYYVVVSGFFTSCGEYVIDITSDVQVAGPTPISNWALFIGLGLILAFAIFRLRRLA
jgi:hypothetical protein